MSTEKKYTVWVGGTEVTDYPVDFDTAYHICSVWNCDEGYDDVVISEAEEN